MNKDEQRPTATVTATIKSKAEAEDGYKLELLVPSFKGQYPTTINRVPAEIATKLITGKTYTLTLERQNLRKKRDGTPYDGSQGWHYWWGLDDVPDQKKVAPEDKSTDAGRGPSGQEPDWATLPTSRDGKPVPPGPDRQELIMLQHATGVVAQAYGDWISRQPMEAVPRTFSDYLKAVAMGATWLLHQHYQAGGYNVPQRGQHATSASAPDIKEEEAY